MHNIYINFTFLSSLPVRECGLKYEMYRHVVDLHEPSLPVRECGLKWRITIHRPFSVCVTPRAGVWIEIKSSTGLRLSKSVTPRAGVWIEITVCRRRSVALVRHSPCGSVD